MISKASFNSFSEGFSGLSRSLIFLDVIIEEMINNRDKQLKTINLSYNEELKILYKYK